jgi:elongation factor Ts
MMNCKRALESAEGDFEKALKLLREQGQATAAKRAGRATAQGVVTSQVSNGKAVLLELNCETDFVAKTDDFQALVVELASGVAAQGWTTPSDVPQNRVQELAAKLGENISLQRFSCYEGSSSSVFGVYIHPSGLIGNIGVLVELSSEKASAEVDVLARDLAMQVAATAPRWVQREDIPSETAESEKAIARVLAQKENKPEKIWDKISEGKLNQFAQQFCLLEQPYIKDAGGKTLVKTVVDQASAKVGSKILVKRFARYKVGEDEV